MPSYSKHKKIWIAFIKAKNKTNRYLFPTADMPEAPFNSTNLC